LRPVQKGKTFFTADAFEHRERGTARFLTDCRTRRKEGRGDSGPRDCLGRKKKKKSLHSYFDRKKKKPDRGHAAKWSTFLVPPPSKAEGTRKGKKRKKKPIGRLCKKKNVRALAR